MLATSEPERGSDSAKAEIALPARVFASHCCCCGVPNRLMRAGAEPLHGEGEIGEPVMARQRLAGDAERAHVERSPDRRHRAPSCFSQPSRPSLRHQLAAGGVDIVDGRPAGSSAHQRFELARPGRGGGPRRTARRGRCWSGIISFPRTPASPWRRRPRRRARNPASACRSPAPALPPRSPGRAPSTIPG